MYLKLMENVLWYSKAMLLHVPLWTKRLCTVTMHHWLTLTGHLLTNRRQPSAGHSPCTPTYVVSSLSGQYTNQGTIWCPVLKVRSTPLFWVSSDSVLLLQCLSLYLFICPHAMTKPTGKLSEVNTCGWLYAVQAERITTWQLSYQGTFPTKRNKRKQKKSESNQKQDIISLWPSSTSIAEQYSSQSNRLQFCTLLCREIENCPQKTAWKSTYFPLAFFPLPNSDFKNRNMGFSFKISLGCLRFFHR